LRGLFLWCTPRDSDSRPRWVVEFGPVGTISRFVNESAFARRDDTLSVLAKASALTLPGAPIADAARDRDAGRRISAASSLARPLRDSDSRPRWVVEFGPAGTTSRFANESAFARRDDTLSVLAKAPALTLPGAPIADAAKGLAKRVAVFAGTLLRDQNSRPAGPRRRDETSGVESVSSIRTADLIPTCRTKSMGRRRA
jgi:hypothetical protein